MNIFWEIMKWVAFLIALMCTIYTVGSLLPLG